MTQQDKPDRLQVWHLDLEGARHEVHLADRGWVQSMTWLVDGEEVASQVVEGHRPILFVEGRGAMIARLSFLGAARRVSLHTVAELLQNDGVATPGDQDPPDPAAVEEELRGRAWLGSGGVDLIPEPGSRAARREAWIREHPRLHALRSAVLALAAVLIPILLLWLLSRLVLSIDLRLPEIPWPDIPWPSIPWPEIPWPSIPWPTVSWPAIPWPRWSMPAWLEPVLQVLRYAWPVLLALVIAGAEIRRRRSQDDLRRRAAEKETRASGQAHSSASSPRTSSDGSHSTSDGSSSSSPST